MASTIREFRHDTAAHTAVALAASVAACLQHAIAARDTALLAVSGGRSPAAVFDALRGHAIEWDKLVVAQVDERWVSPDHADSNSRLIREHLLTGPAAAARFVPMKNEAPDAYAGQAECEAALAALPRPFDVILLGMGEDGHTASLFPGASELSAGLSSEDLCLAITPPAAPHQRMSLTLNGLLDSRLLVLQIGGAAKEAVYRSALAPGPVEDMPIRAVLRQNKVPLDVWLS
ncbi:MAG: 6-phosphogluconolactonase [Pseudomonadota bacterium]|nr:6-phosphogluconolactonase [Pseudomonadota bacterium]